MNIDKRARMKLPESCLFSNPIEFDGIKIRVVELLPDAKELDRASDSEASSG